MMFLTFVGLTTLRTIESGEGPIMDIAHHDDSHLSQSLLVFCTRYSSHSIFCHTHSSKLESSKNNCFFLNNFSDGFVHGWDLRCKKEVWCIKADKTFGRVQCFAMDAHHNWLTIGNILNTTCLFLFFKAFSSYLGRN